MKSQKIPKPVQASLNSLQRLSSQLKKCTSENERKIIQVEHKRVKVDHRKLTRYYNAVENKAKDENRLDRQIHTDIQQDRKTAPLQDNNKGRQQGSRYNS